MGSSGALIDAMNKQPELSRQEMDRLDFVHNTIHQMICQLAGQEVEWDVEVIGEISDLVEELVCRRLKLMSDRQFAPYL